MSIDTLLDNARNSGRTILQIDEPSRTIIYPGGSLLLGVEGDIDSHRLYFEIPSETVGDGIQLGAATVNIYIDFINAEYTTCICEASDKLTVDGTTTFNWLLDKRVAICDGKVEFRVRITDTDAEGKLREWHTANFAATVLDGIDVDDKTPEVVIETSSIYDLKQRIGQVETEIDDIYQSVNNTVSELESKIATYTKVNTFKNLKISSSEYTISGESWPEGDYAIKVDIDSLGTVDLEHDYLGEHIFKGHIYKYSSALFNNASVLFSDIVLAYANSDNSLTNCVFGKLALVLKHLETSTRISLVVIQNPYTNPSYEYCSGTIKQVYKETLS